MKTGQSSRLAGQRFILSFFCEFYLVSGINTSAVFLFKSWSAFEHNLLTTSVSMQEKFQFILKG